MDYLDGRITKEEFIKTRGTKATQNGAKFALNLFGYFTNQQYQKTGQEVVLDIEKEIEKDGKYDRLFRLTNQFVQWLQEDHLDIKIKKNHASTTIRKHTASSIKVIMSYIKQYYEEYGQIDYSERKFKRMVKLPKVVKQELEPLTKEQIIKIINRASPKRKAIYMIMKDTGLRIQEVLLIKKRDFDLNSTPVKLDFAAINDKTNSTNQTRFITSETREFVEPLLESKNDNDYLFITNRDNVRQAVTNEEGLFGRTRKRLGFTERYEHNNRHKITLHSFRAFCSTQLAEAYGEEFAHGYIGHSKYLGQYIRNKNKVPEKFLRAENMLMIYKSVEVIDDSERVRELEMKFDRQQHDVTELKQIYEELTQLKDKSTKQQLEIQRLQNEKFV
jgi:integrase